MTEKIVYENRDTWKYGKSPGYYDVWTDEIHLLNDEETVLGTLIHERTHRARRHKLTFWFAQLVTIQPFVYLMLILLSASAFITVFTYSTVPLLTTLGLFLFFIACHNYEEYKADQAITKNFQPGVLTLNDNP